MPVCPRHNETTILRYPGGDPENRPAEPTCLGCRREGKEYSDRLRKYLSEHHEGEPDFNPPSGPELPFNP